MSRKNPKVLSLVWDLIRGGTEGQCARTAMGHAALGGEHRVGVFRREGYFVDAVEAACGPLYEVDIHHLCEIHTWRMIRRLATFIHEEGFDLVHAWDADAVIFGSMAARRAGVPFISSRRDLGQIYPSHKSWLMRRADRGAKAVVVNAEAIAEQAVKDGLPRSVLQVIPNILDLAEFDQLRQQAVDRDVPEVIMVARLDPEKDGATLLRAIPEMNHKARVMIVGDGGEREALEAQALALGIAERVSFTGTLDLVAPLLNNARVGVLVPRANEGLSNTLLEYMAAALPVVATDCGGNRELVRDGETGFIVPIGDERGLANRVNQLLEDPEWAQRLGAAGRRRIEQGHAPSEIVGRFVELYKDACR